MRNREMLCLTATAMNTIKATPEGTEAVQVSADEGHPAQQQRRQRWR
jgi:hypothetical protein